MRKFLLLAIIAFTTTLTFAQSTGDTIVVETFNYESTSRDTVIEFPTLAGVTYEKILMQYSMRCKDGKVSNGTNRNQGCGEWDYSCNTYITDSTRIDSVNATTKSHSITGFSGTSYDYVTNPYYNLYQYSQANVSQTITSETQSVINTGAIALPNAISTNEFSGRSQYLYTQSELNSAGVVAGNVDGIMLTAQNTSAAKYLRVRVKATTATSLSASGIDTTGFSQVYFSDYNFTSGNNRIQFYAPYNWDGTSNLIFEFSFTNSTPNAALSLTGENVSFTSGLVANNGFNVSVSSGSYLTIPVNNLSAITNEISFSFWAKGDPGVTGTNTSVIFGADANGKKTLNVHLPWSNGRVYFDCGNSGTGSYDRIDKASSASVLEGKWNHWAFTKNGNTGNMKIYLNGVLFHSGTGKTRTLDIQSLTFGAVTDGRYGYQGNINELRIWDTELNQTEVQNWMNKSIDNNHPKYANLVAYYPLNEGSGNTTTDASSAGLTATFNGNEQWSYNRGRLLNTFFTETTNRPNITVLQGTYTLNTTSVTTHDSLEMIANNVKEYQIFPKPGTIQNDSIGAISSTNYWLASNKYVYDGMTGTVISSTPIAKDGTISITDLSYYQRSPMAFEIMSFVTPYGIGLDLGMEGKTWTFDVTDYTPFLKGNQRIYLTNGGQWQEDMDIKFLFIVGTPTHDVLDITQLWKVSARSYQSLLNDTYFAPRDVMMNPNGKSFKVRSMITGHGQEGEFIRRNHSINVNGGSPEFTWSVWKKCGENPIYPQGGTWVYDRAGWCPGMSTMLKESDITTFVTPGQTASIDYKLSTASGDSRYILNHQLVTYGDPNHQIDASITDVISPSNKVEYARMGQTCIDPTVVLTNTGATPLTKATIQYWVNGEQNKMEFEWTGNLGFLESETIVLPANMGLWIPVSGPENTFYAKVLNPNDGTDEYSYNDMFTSKFMVPDVMPEEFIIKFRTNKKGNENSYTIVDDQGTVLYNKSNLQSNTLYLDTIQLGFGCYKLKLVDTGGNGISWWANNDGSGYFQMWKIPTGIAKILQPDFGSEITYNFTIGTPLSNKELSKNTLFKLYPNPAKDHVIIEGKNVNKSSVYIYNAMGQEISLPIQISGNQININTQNLSKGMYFINIIYKDYVESKSLVIQ